MAGGIAWIKAYRQKELPKNYFRAQVHMLRYLGIELMREETIKQKIYTFFALFLIMFQGTFTEALELYVQLGNWNAALNVTTFLFTHFIGMMKVAMLFYNRKKFGNMIRTFHSKPFLPDTNRGGENEEKYLRKTVKTTESLYIFFFFLIYVTLISGAVAFVQSRIFNDKEDWRHPYVPITVVPTADTPIFEIAGVFQVIWVSVYATLLISIDTLLVAILAHLTIQFRMLNNAFRSIRTRSKKIYQTTEGDDKDEGVILNKLLGGYIEHHLRVLELAEQLEELCNMVYLLIFLSSVVLLSFLLYRMSLVHIVALGSNDYVIVTQRKMSITLVGNIYVLLTSILSNILLAGHDYNKNPIGSIEFIHCASYYCIVVYQIGMYCYWGNEVTSQSAEVAKAVAEADWVGAPRSVMKAMVVIIARSQKPLYMTAGKFVNLSIDTFTRIVKGSFSYYVVLQQTQEDEN